MDRNEFDEDNIQASFEAQQRSQFERQAGLADASGTGQGEQARCLAP